MARSGIALVSSLALHAWAGVLALESPSPLPAPARAIEVTMTTAVAPTPASPAPAPASPAPHARAHARPRRAPVAAPDPRPASTSPVLDAVVLDPAHTFAIAASASALEGMFANGLGGDGDDDTNGRAGAGSGAPNVPCGDPATGVWTARFHWRSLQAWSFVTLEVARDGAALVGEIHLHEWADDALPDERARTDAAREHHLRTRAAGSVMGDRMSFGWHGDRGMRTSQDRFSGRLVPAENRFDAIWNDDLRAHDQRIRFRRVRCAS